MLYHSLELLIHVISRMNYGKQIYNCYAGKVNDSNIDKTIRLAGWVENIIDNGGIIFVDLRDETGTI